jgi:RNA polymerase sigma-70 factor (ECF subfamily)
MGVKEGQSSMNSAEPAAAGCGADAPPQEGSAAAASVLTGLLEHRETVFAICLGFTRNRCDAEDLAQEAYLRAHARLGDLEKADSAKAWLCRIARNACRDQRRRARVRQLWLAVCHRGVEPATAVTPETQLQRDEQVVLVKSAVSALPGRLRDVLVLREYGELSYAEVAAALSLPVGTVMSRLHRARAILAASLRGRW